MEQALNLNTNNTVYAENILPKFCNFDDQNSFDFTIVSGSGVVEFEINSIYNSQPTINQGKGALKITNTAFDTTDLIIQSSGTKDGFLQTAPILDLISAGFYKNSNQNIIVELEIYFIGSLYNVLEFDLSNFDAEKWIRLGQTFLMTEGDYAFRWIFKADLTSPTNISVLHIDNFCIQHFNHDTDVLNIPYQPAKDIVITQTQTLDFPSISNNSIVTLSFTMTGAIVGDSITMVAPVAINSLHLLLDCYVSDVDEVTVKAHNSSGGAINPPSGDFNFKIVR